MLDDDILDLLEILDHSTSSSYQKMPYFCHNALSVQVQNAIQDLPESIHDVLEGVFDDFTSSMEQFCKAEDYYSPHPDTWRTFFMEKRPDIDSACERLITATAKYRFEQSQQRLVELSIDLIEALQTGTEFFEKEARRAEEQSVELQQKMKALVQQTKAIHNFLNEHPTMQEDASIQHRCKAIEEDCYAVVRLSNSIYQSADIKGMHPAISADYIDATEEGLDKFHQELHFHFAPALGTEGSDSMVRESGWYLDTIKDRLPDIEANTKKGRQLFSLLLEGIQKEFRKAVSTLQEISSRKEETSREAHGLEVYTYALVKDLMSRRMTKQQFLNEMNNAAKTYVTTAKKVYAHQRKYEAAQIAN